MKNNEFRWSFKCKLLALAPGQEMNFRDYYAMVVSGALLSYPDYTTVDLSSTSAIHVLF